MRLFALAAALLLLAAPAGGEGSDASTCKFFGHALAPGVNYACFARVYDAARLAKHPRQNVADMAQLARLDGTAPLQFPDKGEFWTMSESGFAAERPRRRRQLFRLDRAAGAHCAPLAADKGEAAMLQRQP